MRIHFQERPWDLCLCVAYTVVLSVALLATSTGNILAILLVLFVPGYILAAVLFPAAKDTDWIGRIALSFGLSIAVIPLLGLALNLSPWGLRFVPVTVSVTLFAVLGSAAAYLRRMQLPVGERLSLTVDLHIASWNEYTITDKALTVALAISIVVAAGTLAYVLAVPRPGGSFTEFYLLGPSGNASGYPTALNVSQPGSVILGIANHETASVNYTVRIDLVGVRIVYNATLGYNETVEVNRTTWSWVNLSLANSQNRTQPYTFQINAVGLWKVQFLLFRDGDLSFVYRQLRLFVRVT